MVIFTPHNLLKDPPFSKLDLVVCRNLLIYLKKEVQNQVFELLHYSLLPDGFAILGNSESTNNSDLFKVIESEYSILQKKNVQGPDLRLPVFPQMKAALKSDFSEEKPERQVASEQLHQKTVEKFGPPSILLDNNYQLLHISETAGRYLQVPPGRPSRDIFRFIPKEMMLELRSVIHSSKKENNFVRSRPLQLSINGKKKQLFLSARHVESENEEGVFMVMFEEFEEAAVTDEKKVDTDENKGLIKQIEKLENELQDNRQQLQAIIEEYETSREEMKASNEELQSANEELRSTMEELETSKEELQSVNEELTTVNQENRHKVEELSILSGDLHNLLAATDIATLFIKRDLRIMRFTPKLKDLFNIRSDDKGRPFSDITNKLNYPDLLKDIQEVLKKLQVIEREVTDVNDDVFISRIMPYRTPEDKIDGVVLTFINITERKKAEEQVQASEERYRNITHTMFNMLYRMNENWSEMYELEGKDLLEDTRKNDKNWMKKYIPPHEQKLVTTTFREAIRDKKTFALDHQVYLRDGSQGWISSRAIPVFNENGGIVEWIGAAIDIAEIKEMEKRLTLEKNMPRV